jgi:methionyl-tRNA formyltransferase
MKLADLRIVFMGTPDFAVASLDTLVTNGCNIVAVITAPDKPGGRGMQLQQSAVKQYALNNKLNILQPEKLKATSFLDELKLLQAHVQIVVAFRMLPEVVWNMPPMGTINVHGSLLPQYRGAAPINWAIINGEKETGVTTFKLKHEIDTGDILLQQTISISENETAEELYNNMKTIGAQLLLKTLEHLLGGTITEIPQNKNINLPPQVLRHAPKIFTENCEINFLKTVAEVHNLIRGLSPYPGAFTFLENKKFKIFECKKVLTSVQSAISKLYETDGKSYLNFYCADGYIQVLTLQLEGKKKMGITDFLRGYHFTT